MKCKNCGINDSDSILCESCWKMAIEISDRQNKEKLERSMTKTDFDKWLTFLDEQGVEYSVRDNEINIYETSAINVYDANTCDLCGDIIAIKFDKDGRLMK